MWWLVVVLLLGRTSSKSISVNSTDDNQLTKYPPSPLQAGQWLGSCSEDPAVKSCLKMKSLMLLEDLALKDSPIYLFGKSMLLVKNQDVRLGGRMLPLSLEELNSSLPKDEVSREETLDSLIFVSLENFVKSRALQIRLPDLFSWYSWKSLAEGRRKGGGFGGGGWAMVLGGGMMAALGLASIAMMSGKAMMVSMMALMLSAMAAFRRGGGGGDQTATTYEVINVPTGHGHHARSMGRPRSLETGVDLPVDHLVYGPHHGDRAAAEAGPHRTTDAGPHGTNDLGPQTHHRDHATTDPGPQVAAPTTSPANIALETAVRETTQ